MALRLTATSVTPQTTSPDVLAGRAEALLNSGDAQGYAALFAQATELPDTTARYVARLRLVESGLAVASHAAPSVTARIYFVLTEKLVEILEEEPREPLLLNYAGIAFYELWSLDAARALFRAAARLDDGLAHLRRNLRETDQRRRLAAGGRGRRPPLYPELPALARRASSAAQRAVPAQGQTLSLCMIVKNEEEMLPKCLAAAAPFVDEIVIVDTGSTDATIEIARSYGARVIEREWTGSFADARNVSFEQATGDWLMYLDADEVMAAEDGPALRELLGQVWREAFFVVETSYTGEEDSLTGVVHNSLRIFRNRRAYRFEGRLHEQITAVPFQVPGRVEPSGVRVQHYGYLGAVRDAKGKSKRNIDLLRAQRAENGSNAFWHFNLGMEHAAIHEYASAVSELQTAWQLVREQGLLARQFVPALVSRLTSALVSAGRNEEAIALADDALPLFPGFTDLLYFKGWALVGLKRDDEAAEVWRTCLSMGDAPARFTAGLGAGSFMALYALSYLHIAHGRHDDARALLERCLAEHPSFSAAVGPFVSVLLAQGMPGEAAVAELQQRVATPLNAAARYLVATTLHGAGALAAAEPQYRQVLDARPSAAHVRVSLAELLIALGRDEDAAREAQLVDDEDPNVAQAGRLELWGTVAAGKLDGLASVLARADARGVPAAHRQVFEQWAGLIAGNPPGVPLPVNAAPMLGVILERMLARHDFDTFASLVGLLRASELPQREQRELLATMYLRFGFIKSAAEEWMAVCAKSPDARALVGLGRVARAHGLVADAVTFANEAAVLDPRAPEPRQLLTELELEAAQAAPAPVS